jgi:hypothetical protein
MRRKVLAFVAVFVLGGATGWLVRGPVKAPGASGATEGATISVMRPTGRAVPGGDVDGKPQAEIDSVRLRVYHTFRTGEAGSVGHNPPPDGKAPWRLTFGDPPHQTVVLAVPE